MLLQAKEKIDNIVFTCACNMLIEHDKWHDEDEDDDVAADFPKYSIDQRIKVLQRGPADRSYVGGDNIDICDVEVECEWTVVRSTDRKLHALLLIEYNRMAIAKDNKLPANPCIS
jgi:hypothetical protein